jgi:hypothetical protein
MWLQIPTSICDQDAFYELAYIVDADLHSFLSKANDCLLVDNNDRCDSDMLLVNPATKEAIYVDRFDALESLNTHWYKYKLVVGLGNRPINDDLEFVLSNKVITVGPYSPPSICVLFNDYKEKYTDNSSKTILRIDKPTYLATSNKLFAAWIVTSDNYLCLLSKDHQTMVKINISYAHIENLKALYLLNLPKPNTIGPLLTTFPKLEWLVLPNRRYSRQELTLMAL